VAGRKSKLKKNMTQIYFFILLFVQLVSNFLMFFYINEKTSSTNKLFLDALEKHHEITKLYIQNSALISQNLGHTVVEQVRPEIHTSTVLLIISGIIVAGFLLYFTTNYASPFIAATYLNDTLTTQSEISSALVVNTTKDATLVLGELIQKNYEEIIRISSSFDMLLAALQNAGAGGGSNTPASLMQTGTLLLANVEPALSTALTIICRGPNL
jgi:hypothetical protein